MTSKRRRRRVPGSDVPGDPPDRDYALLVSTGAGSTTIALIAALAVGWRSFKRFMSRHLRL
ncbi:MAG: hypothetical protein HY263_06880 [Chloroflexi bacterium]|nr:hypothetical protein [Chloroflexota bacterium]